MREICTSGSRKVVVLVAVAVICGVLIEVDPENETVG
jgi:hypothetical protein